MGFTLLSGGLEAIGHTMPWWLDTCGLHIVLQRVDMSGPHTILWQAEVPGLHAIPWWTYSHAPHAIDCRRVLSRWCHDVGN